MTQRLINPNWFKPKRRRKTDYTNRTYEPWMWDNTPANKRIEPNRPETFLASADEMASGGWSCDYRRDERGQLCAELPLEER